MGQKCKLILWWLGAVGGGRGGGRCGRRVGTPTARAVGMGVVGTGVVGTEVVGRI